VENAREVLDQNQAAQFKEADFRLDLAFPKLTEETHADVMNSDILAFIKS